MRKLDVLFIGILEFLILANWAHASSNGFFEAVSIGVLERDEKEIRLRVAFQRTKDGWKQFIPESKKLLPESANATLPSNAKWFVTFDGSLIGSVVATRPTASRGFAWVGTMQVSPAQQIPTIGRLSSEFSNFDGKPVFRPLVAVSQPNAADPDRWKPFSMSRVALAELLPILSNRIKDSPDVYPCAETGDKVKQSIPAQSVAVEKSYRSSADVKLIAIRLKDEANICDKTMEPYRGLFWFLKQGHSAPSFLATDLKLLDAGDYDRDGRSEVVFMRDSYNRTGYVLYFSGFQRSLEFSWLHH